MTEAPDDLELLAAEFVLGTLDEAERRRALALTYSDVGFASRVAAWERYFAPLCQTLAPVEPSPAVWRRIEAAITKRQPAPARPARRPSFFQRMGVWRGFALGAATVTAALILFISLVIGPFAPTVGPALIATLGEEDRAPVWLVTVDPDADVAKARPLAEVDLTGRTPELWLVAGEGPPRSVGLLNPEAPVNLPLASGLGQAMAENAVLAISLEPPGGSPTGLPTGPVVYHGVLHSLQD